jgi:hypothetical protein
MSEHGNHLNNDNICSVGHRTLRLESPHFKVLYLAFFLSLPATVRVLFSIDVGVSMRVRRPRTSRAFPPHRR